MRSTYRIWYELSVLHRNLCRHFIELLLFSRRRMTVFLEHLNEDFLITNSDYIINHWRDEWVLLT